MPRTRPRASSSGPPEFPWLIAASVWIAPTRAEQGAAGVPGVDRGVGRDRAAGREAGERLDRAVERGDDADRQRLVLAERAADRGPRRADGEIARRAERQRTQRQAGRVD